LSALWLLFAKGQHGISLRKNLLFLKIHFFNHGFERGSGRDGVGDGFLPAQE
jgi:hypothetical protein